MRNILGTLLSSAMLLTTSAANADASFTLTANFSPSGSPNLSDDGFASGTLSINTATGVVTGENVTLFRLGAPVDTFTGPPQFQGAVTSAGANPGYLFTNGVAPARTLIIDVPGSSLIGYAGGQLCSSFTSFSLNCGVPYLLSNNAPTDFLFQGFLTSVSDTVRLFDLDATYANGEHAVGTLAIDVTSGVVLSEQISFLSGSAVVSQFYDVFQSGQGYFFGTTDLLSMGADGRVDLLLPVADLVGYNGGFVCSAAHLTGCDNLPGAVTGPGPFSSALTGTLTLAVPEPGTYVLMTMGLAALAVASRRRKRGQSSCSASKSYWPRSFRR